jgi:uncharacterized OB-fold protein
MAYQLPDPSPATFAQRDDGQVPIGLSCSACKAISFPSGPSCRMCGSHNVAAIDLERHGRVLNFTRIATQGAPIAVGEIRLDDGVKIFGAIEPSIAAAVGAKVTFEPVNNTMIFKVEGAL